MSELAEHLVLRILTHRARIEQNDVRFRAIFRRRIAHLFDIPVIASVSCSFI